MHLIAIEMEWLVVIVCAICLDLVGIGLGLHIICTGGDRSYMK